MTMEFIMIYNLDYGAQFYYGMLWLMHLQGWFYQQITPAQTAAQFASSLGISFWRNRCGFTMFYHQLMPVKTHESSRFFLEKCSLNRQKIRTSLAKHDDLPWISWLFTKQWWN